MPKITATEQEDFAVLPADSIVLLKIEDISVETVQGKNGDWEKLQFKFKVMDIQAVGNGGNPDAYASLITRNIWGSVPFKLTTHAENRLRQWVEAILAMEIGPGFELDTDLLLGKTVRGVTSTYESKKNNNSLRHQVDSLLPYGSVLPTSSMQTTATTPAASTTSDVWGGGYSDEPPF